MFKRVLRVRTVKEEVALSERRIRARERRLEVKQRHQELADFDPCQPLINMSTLIVLTGAVVTDDDEDNLPLLQRVLLRRRHTDTAHINDSSSMSPLSRSASAASIQLSPDINNTEARLNASMEQQQTHKHKRRSNGALRVRKLRKSEALRIYAETMRNQEPSSPVNTPTSRKRKSPKSVNAFATESRLLNSLQLGLPSSEEFITRSVRPRNVRRRRVLDPKKF